MKKVTEMLSPSLVQGTEDAAVKTAFNMADKGTKEVYEATLDKAKDGVTNVGEEAKRSYEYETTRATEDMKDKSTPIIIETMVGLGANLVSNLTGQSTPAQTAEWIGNQLASAGPALAGIAGDVATSMSGNIINNVSNNMQSTIDNTLDKLTGGYGHLLSGPINNTITSITTAATDFIGNQVDTLLGRNKEIAESSKVTSGLNTAGVVSNLKSTIANQVPDLPQEAMDIVTSACDEAGAIADELINNSLDNLTETANSILSDSFMNLSINTENVIGDTIKDLYSVVETTASDLGEYWENANIVAETLLDRWLSEEENTSEESDRDARSVFSEMMGGEGNKKNGVSADVVKNSNLLVNLSNLQVVGGMPPMGDNIADPPPFIDNLNNSIDVHSSSANLSLNRVPVSFSGFAGSEYTERCIASGQFLLLIPLKIEPSLLSSLWNNYGPDMLKGEQKVSNRLQSMGGRLGLTNYGMSTNVDSKRYFSSYAALLKAAMLSLGISPEVMPEKLLRELLPTHLLEACFSGSVRAGISEIRNEFIPLTGVEYGNDSEYEDYDPDDRSAIVEYVLSEGGNMTYANLYGRGENNGIDRLLTQEGYRGFLKYIANLDVSEAASLPNVSFYLDGPVTMSFDTSLELSPSAIAQATTDYFNKGANSAASTTINAMNSSDKFAIKAMGDISGRLSDAVGDGMKEWAYHSSGGGLANTLANTHIPKLISDTQSNFSYTCKITETAIGSDPVSLLRVQDLYCKLIPFVTPVSDGKNNTLVPRAPMYCSAFVKGAMNLQRAAITSLSMQTDQALQTSEGIPTSMSITINITPLMSVSTIPNFGKYWNSGNEATIINAMYNPLSVFSIIATMCGQNTVLSKYPQGIFDYFVYGKLDQVFQSVKGTGTYVGMGVTDWFKSKKHNFGRNIITN